MILNKGVKHGTMYEGHFISNAIVSHLPYLCYCLVRQILLPSKANVLNVCLYYTVYRGSAAKYVCLVCSDFFLCFPQYCSAVQKARTAKQYFLCINSCISYRFHQSEANDNKQSS